MTDISIELANNNLCSAVNDYNTAVNIYNKCNTEANESKVKEKKAFLAGYVSAFQTLSGKIINIYYENILDKYPIITNTVII